ncbi:hypothetical protein [Sporosarcina cascadiensis]|uniref:hypothetical protein n=1 Tax=Sporosarcina cascadiensis TaxID=2660747 RepID=UPI00129BDFBD|nr:hypothetical protein [Sporosarcina cascadiensis]
MVFFKKMNDQELINSKRGITIGFFVYMLVSAINYFYYLAKDSILFSPSMIFWSGLLAFFAGEFIFNMKDQLSKAKSSTYE